MRNQLILVGATILAACLLNNFQLAQNSSFKGLSGAEETKTHLFFRKYLSKYNLKVSTPAEFFERLKIFIRNVKEIEATNLANKGQFLLAINQFAHLSPEEFQSKYLIKPPVQKPGSRGPLFENPYSKDDPPAQFQDWRKEGAVNPIKNQADCGSCWAFGVTAAMECSFQQKHKKLISLSEQQLVDCSGSYNTQGCNGGWGYDAFRYIQANGQMLESAYPYTASQNVCKYDKSKVVAQIDDYKIIPTKDCTALLAAAYQQVVQVTVDARAWQFYFWGIFKASKCGSEQDHVVSLVGYNVTGEVSRPYYIIRNSWGTHWGQKGYMQLEVPANREDGACGICLNAAIPTVSA